jgi:hypothetical protein
VVPDLNGEADSVERSIATNLGDVIAAHLRARAGAYVGAGAAEAPEVRLVSEHPRQLACLYRFQVRGVGEECALLVKVAGGTGAVGGASEPDRPRIMPVADPELAFTLQHRAMRQIHEHFAGLGDPRFGSIRVFEVLPEHRAMVMEAVDHPNLRHLALHPTRARARVLERAFRHAGAWLEAYHRMPGPSGGDVLHGRRRDYVEFVRALTSFLRARTSHARFLARVEADAVAAADRWLPDRLPLGLVHGDFAMRNVLVGPAERVTGLDTLARYRTAVYRDIGYFLADLRCSWAPALARGALLHPGRIARYERAFVAGYFGDREPPRAAVRLYVVQVLLERWCAALVRASAGGRTGGHAVTASLASAFFQRAIARSLDRGADAGAAGPAHTGRVA